VTEEAAEEVEALRRRRVPCLIAYLHPFRLVQTDSQSPWKATIEQINCRGWDYSALHELVGGIDVGLPSPLHLVVGRDGALALPRIDSLRSTQAAVAFFNRCLAGLLLGGIYCEAISPDGLDLGSIIDWTYIRAHTFGLAAANGFHQRVRYSQAGPMEAIALLQPRQVAPVELRAAMEAGLQMLNAVSLVRGEYLLKGATGLARLDWGSALANLWIVIEQVVGELWERRIVAQTLEADLDRARRSQLMDTRTWTASARIEMLYQKGVISLDATRALGKARKARNDLHHSGRHPSSDDAWAAYEGVTELVVVALDGKRPRLFDLDLADHAMVDPFALPRRFEPTHWIAIPKLPGEEELERAEAQALRKYK
jgi:hypothetical protein